MLWHRVRCAGQNQTPPKWIYLAVTSGLIPAVACLTRPIPLIAGFAAAGIGQGAGGAFACNFSSHWALEADFGHNCNGFGYETTFSAGPRLMFRTPEMNLFLHTLLGVNEFNVKTLETTKTGVGGILGGGMDFLCGCIV